MSGNVITHERFGLDDAAKERLGVEMASGLTEEQVAEMKLGEPQYGETTLGECTEEEAAIFHMLHESHRELEGRSRALVGDALTTMGSTIRDGDLDKSVGELLQSGEVKLDFPDEDAAEEYFRLQQRGAYLHATFYFMIGERLGKHHQRLGVRSKMRIVSVEKRY